MTTVTPTARRSRRTPEQMIADLQAELTNVKARAERQASAPPATPARARRRRSKQPTSPSTEAAPPPLINTLRAEIQSCVDAFSVDLVDLIQRSTLDAVQRVLGGVGDPNGGGETTGNEPRFSPISARAPSGALQSTETVPLTFKAYERMAIERALAENGGNAIEAGQRLKMTKSATYRRIQVLGIRKPSQGGTFEVSPHDPVARAGEPASLEAYEKAAILRAIDECGGNVLAAANLMKAGKSTLYRRMEALGIPSRSGAGRAR